MLTRRRFLQTGAAGLATLAMPLGIGQRAGAAGTDKVLVVLFLRGGADGLHLVPPTLDPAYYDLRPTLQVPAGSELTLDSSFGMHPALSELHGLFHQRKLDVIHAIGSPDDTRSHFDAQDFMELAAPGDRSANQGWLNKTLERIGGGDALAGVTLDIAKDLSLQGPAQSLQLRSVSTYALQGTPVAKRRAGLSSLYDTPGDLLSDHTQEAFDVLDRVNSVDLVTQAPYPGTPLASQLAEIAALIKADIGVRIATTSAHDWDTHDRQAETAYTPMRDLSLSLSAFHQDLGGDASRVLTLVMTEFGRTAIENGAFGTDHGRGSVMFALGGGITGGRVLQGASWPGLDESDPFRDLPVTTDFRDAFAEVLKRHMGLNSPGQVMPNFTASQNRYPGLYA